MTSKLQMTEAFNGSILRNRNPPEPVDFLRLQGKFRCEQWSEGKLYRELGDAPNIVLNAGKLAILNTYFNFATQIAAASWFMLPISSAGYSAIAAADTAAAHAGWTEFTDYVNATRPAWGQGAAAANQITNASPVSFVASAGGTVKGFGIVSNSTKLSTAGILFCAGLFTAGDAVLVTNDELRVTYTLGT